MAYPDDMARMCQVLMEETTSKDHVFNRFMFGSLKSLKGQGKSKKKEEKKKTNEEKAEGEQEEDADAAAVELDDEIVEELAKDVQKFFDNEYSADRMKLVVQVKTSDNLKDVREWVTESFNTIPNDNLGAQ